MAAKQAYMKRITLAYVNGDEYTEINSNKVKYIMIEHSYEDKVMPIIYLGLAIENEMYKKITENKNTAKMYLRVQRYDAYSNTAVYRDDINDQFTYFLSSNTPSYTTDLNENDSADTDYRNIIIGMMDTRIMNTMRKTFSGIRHNTDLHTLIYTAVEDTKIVMRTPEFNKQYDTIVIPPLSSRKDMLDYIFNKDPFYSTKFLYFMDSDKSYLLDRSGDPVGCGDDNYNKVLIDIRSVSAEESYNEGVEIIKNSYYFYVNPANTNIMIDSATEKVANQVVAVDEDGTNIVDLDINTTTSTTTKQTFKRMELEDAIVYKNSVEESQVVIEIVKENIDSSIITPNKTYNVSNFEGYTDYNGRYLLLYKKEVITGSNDEFKSVTTFGIKKLSNIQRISTEHSTTTASNSKVTTSTAKGTTYSSRTTQVTSSKKTTTTSSSKK